MRKNMALAPKAATVISAFSSIVSVASNLLTKGLYREIYREIAAGTAPKNGINARKRKSAWAIIAPRDCFFGGWIGAGSDLGGAGILTGVGAGSGAGA